MKKTAESKNLIRYGITPAAFLQLGWLVFVAVLIAASVVFRLLTWLLR